MTAARVCDNVFPVNLPQKTQWKLHNSGDSLGHTTTPEGPRRRLRVLPKISQQPDQVANNRPSLRDRRGAIDYDVLALSPALSQSWRGTLQDAGVLTPWSQSISSVKSLARQTCFRVSELKVVSQNLVNATCQSRQTQKQGG